jgi:hypothetical protein
MFHVKHLARKAREGKPAPYAGVDRNAALYIEEVRLRGGKGEVHKLGNEDWWIFLAGYPPYVFLKYRVDLKSGFRILSRPRPFPTGWCPRFWLRYLRSSSETTALNLWLRHCVPSRSGCSSVPAASHRPALPSCQPQSHSPASPQRARCQQPAAALWRASTRQPQKMQCSSCQILEDFTH